MLSRRLFVLSLMFWSASCSSFTNLAMALRKSPAISQKIRRLLVMGGNISVPGNTTPYAEFNFLFDPEAAEVVLSSAILQKLIFPLDLSNQTVLNKDRYEEIVKIDAPYTGLLRKDRGPKFEDANYTVQSWDTTVAAYLIDPDYIIGSKDMPLKVVIKIGPKYGAVETATKRPPKIKVMTSMNAERFFGVLKSGLTSAPAAR